MTMLIIEETSLSESATTNTALIDNGALERAVTKSLATVGDKRYDPRFFDYEIQVSAAGLGAATSIDIDGMGPAGVYTSIAATVAAGTITVVGPEVFYRILRITWNGGDGSGEVAFWATPKFNGLM